MELKQFLMYPILLSY